jgi:hypothetical protein
MKSIVWRDKTRKKGKLKTRKPNFMEGTIISEKMNGKEVHYRSGYEREVYQYLEVLPEVVSYDTETIEIPYFFEGKQHKYLPDLQIVFTDASIEVWEVKPASQTTLPRNEAKWKAARDFCRIRGWKFNVMTEVGIGKLKCKVQQLMND